MAVLLMTSDTETNKGHTDSRIRIQCPSAAWSYFNRPPLIGWHICVCVHLHLHKEESVRFTVFRVHASSCHCCTGRPAAETGQEQRSGVNRKVMEMRFAVRSRYTCTHISVPFGRSTNCLKHSSQKSICPLRWRHSCPL